MLPVSRESCSEQKLALIQGRNCDKYDYLISVACGAIAGLVDIFLVDAPGKGVLNTWTDDLTDRMVMKVAKLDGWQGSTHGNDIASAIGFLERKHFVNYDQQNSARVNNAFSMGTRNHHLKSLAHSASPIGLFFSILDQFQSKATFVSNGTVFRIDTDPFELQGNTFYEKLFYAFCNWLGHIMSDIAGSSGGRGNSDGRGSGIAIPFYELFQFADVGQIQIGKDRQSFATLMVRVFQEEYDVRFGAAMSLPVILNELFIRAAWAVKQHFCHHRDWDQCVPSSNHADLRCMLIVGNCTLCIFDGTDALIRSGGSPIQFVLHLNIIAWFKLVLRIFKEIQIRYDFTYEDLKLQLQRINNALDEYLAQLKAIDFEAYERELSDIRAINNVLLDSNAGTEQIYQYFSSQGISMQFHSFEEFDEKMQDDDFILKI